MSNARLIKDAKAHMVHKIAPTLHKTIRGRFQAVLLGLYRNHAEIAINLINGNREVLKHFGKQVVPVGGSVIVDQFSSMWDLGIKGAMPVKAFFQVWVIGHNTEHTESEIALRLVDESRKELVNFGSMVRRIGETITLNGLEITVTIYREA